MTRQLPSSWTLCSRDEKSSLFYCCFFIVLPGNRQGQGLRSEVDLAEPFLVQRPVAARTGADRALALPHPAQVAGFVTTCGGKQFWAGSAPESTQARLKGITATGGATTTIARSTCSTRRDCNSARRRWKSFQPQSVARGARKRRGRGGPGRAREGGTDHPTTPRSAAPPGSSETAAAARPGRELSSVRVVQPEKRTG